MHSDNNIAIQWQYILSKCNELLCPSQNMVFRESTYLKDISWVFQSSILSFHLTPRHVIASSVTSEMVEINLSSRHHGFSVTLRLSDPLSAPTIAPSLIVTRIKTSDGLRVSDVNQCRSQPLTSHTHASFISSGSGPADPHCHPWSASHKWL